MTVITTVGCGKEVRKGMNQLQGYIIDLHCRYEKKYIFFSVHMKKIYFFSQHLFYLSTVQIGENLPLFLLMDFIFTSFLASYFDHILQGFGTVPLEPVPLEKKTEPGPLKKYIRKPEPQKICGSCTGS